MQTNIPKALLETRHGKEADAILRSCVHCGFCSATCPTYQIQGDELDSPRGRIYQIKRVLEGNQATRNTQLHLDRCLTCLNCESTCPSGVEYNRLLDIGRFIVEKQVKRSPKDRLLRWLMRKIFPYSGRVKYLMAIAHIFRPLLPSGLKKKIPARQKITPQSFVQHKRKMLILEGCVQSVMTPLTNHRTRQLLDQLGIELIAPQQSGCCGSVSHHFSKEQEANVFMRKNIDAWWPYVEQGEIEALVVTASGCGKMLKEYGAVLQDDPEYAEKARVISELSRDLSEIISEDEIRQFKRKQVQTLAFHAPCTLQHGLKLPGKVESLLRAAGYSLVNIDEPHLCCGSAGTYSILQPVLSQKLLRRKLEHLEKNKPELIVTANVGCQTHLNSRSTIPVLHWIELFE